MFGLDFLEPTTRWLNITNLALGIVTLVCCLAVAWGVAAEVFVRLRKRVALPRPIDDHTFAVSSLGLTMADGGEKVDPDSETKH